MAVSDQVITSDYALYNGDCVEVIADMPSACVDLSVYSPPFAGLFQYSGDERDFSNNPTREGFYRQYGFLVDQIERVTKPGRMSAVHCMDISMGDDGSYHDLPGRIIALHEEAGFQFMGRILKWNEPLKVRLRTMVKSLAHKTICDDSTRSSVAGADYILFFRKRGENKVPVTHERGFLRYYGSDVITQDEIEWRGFQGDQKKNKFSQRVWRRYASSVWMDIRSSNDELCGDGMTARAIVDDGEAREPDDLKHVHPLQLDVIHRCCELYSNPGETVFTPFMGVGSEVYGAVYNGRRGIGVELKGSYYRQAVKNVAKARQDYITDGNAGLFSVKAAE